MRQGTLRGNRGGASRRLKDWTGAAVAQKTEGTTEPRGARQDYPEDRFDRVPRSGRVGAHRFTAQPRYVSQYLIAALLGFALLTTAGIGFVIAIDKAGQLPGDRPKGTSSTAQTPDAVLDPEATVAVLNGTETTNLAAALDQIITQEQWGTILFSGSASASDVQISAVFYSDEADASAAAGLAAKLGGLSTYQADEYQEYGSQLVVLLGADYAGPGIEEAKNLDGAGSEEPAEGEPQIDPETGYEIDPETGLLIDPGTGWLIDPVTGWPVDPATGMAVDPATLPAE